ncbi:MAG: hypothetical protein EZS28_021108 [Streblomastix strix]|uniref:Ubiquitin-like domain-containing protein n=1 Tax=Streblomastix strix TaxID=222440 RepID=A0A5J4VLA1_9EUKA|nr:MAG: hypothetical protein EZS28_021108 [Streblomastix strix]
MSHNNKDPKAKPVNKPQPKAQSTPEFKITVQQPSGEKTVLTVKGTDSVRDLKDNIGNFTGIPVFRMNVALKGQTLLDEKTLNDYKIKDKELLNLLIDWKNAGPQKGDKLPFRSSLTVNIKTSTGKELELDLSNEYTIADSKLQLLFQTEIPVEQQIFQFKGQVLDDNKTLFDYDIRIGDDIFVKVIDA